MRCEKRGLSVGGLLSIMAILIVLAAGLARLAVTNLHLEARSQAGTRALNLARTAAAQAIAEVLADPTFGKDGAPEATISYTNPLGDGLVTFNPDRATSEGWVYSTNNLDETRSVVGAHGQSVPADTLRLMARGRSGGVERTIEAVIEIPAFPWAVAATGTVTAGNGVLVGSLPEGMWPPVAEELLPADVISNDSSPQAVNLGADTTILGDVEAVGGVVFSASTVSVSGAVSESMEPTELPLLHATDYDPALTGLTHDNLDALVPGTEPLTVLGAARRAGSLNLPGGLILSKGHLFVDGDLTLGGTLQGEGVLVVTGDLRLADYANLEGATNLAVLADGQLHLGGQSPNQSRFRGILYAGRGIEASKLTLVGSLVAAGPGASVNLSETVVVAENLPPREMSKEFYIGTLDPANPRYHDESVSDTLPPSGSLLRLKVSKEPGEEFPIQVEFQYRTNPPYHYTISGEADRQLVQWELQGLVDDWTQVPRDAWVETIFDRFPLSGFTSQVGPPQRGDGPASDLSLLIPAKDRIRVISWFER